jgi:hypothetical protein
MAASSAWAITASRVQRRHEVQRGHEVQRWTWCSSSPARPLPPESLLDRPAAPGHADQLAQRHWLGCVAAVEGQFTGVAVTPDQQRPASAAARILPMGMVGVVVHAHS